MGERGSLEALDVPWARSAPARAARGSVLRGLLGPAMDFSTRRTVMGLDNFDRLTAPGTRSRDGSVGRLRSGAAVLAAQYGLPLVPIHASGTHDVMPVGWYWMTRRPGKPLPRRHPIEIRFGAPIQPRGVEQRSEVMERVRAFFEQAGADTTPAERKRELVGSAAP